MKDEDFVQWLGGFFDADGSVFSSRESIYVNISQSEKTVLDKINDFYGNIFSMTSRASETRTQFQIALSNDKAIPILSDLKKSCIIKHPQVCLALERLRHTGLKNDFSRQERKRTTEKITFYNNNHYDQELINKRPYENLNIQYIAGFLDGDGCIAVTKRMSPYISIVQSNDTLMLDCIQQMYPDTRRKDEQIRLIFEKKDAIRGFLNDVLPYLIYKKNQAIYMLHFLDADTDEEKQDLYQKIKDAKKFDLDSMSYTAQIKYMFEDLDKNYTREELFLSKKLKEIKETRQSDNWDKLIFNDPGNIQYINPVLEFCEDRHTNSLWQYYKKKTSSIVGSKSIGRNVKILVKDSNTNKYIGLISLGSDFYAITERDRYIGKQTGKNPQEYINYIANLNCCVPLQPFGYNCNGGKLLVKLAFSREVAEYWQSKYKQPLLCITTMGVNGKSIMYDRLKEIKMIGYTKGLVSNLHIPEEVVSRAMILFNHSGLTCNRVGVHDRLKVLFNHLNIKDIYSNHVIRKSIYIGWLHKSEFGILNPNTEDLKTVNELNEEWKVRWCLPRIKRIQMRQGIELLNEKSDIFKHAREYRLPLRSNSTQPQSPIVQKYTNNTPLLVQKLYQKPEVILHLLSLKNTLSTQEIADIILNDYEIILRRDEISKLYAGEYTSHLPSAIQNSQEYKSTISSKNRRVYSAPKSEKFLEIAKKSKNRGFSDEEMYKILEEKKTAQSAEECGKKHIQLNGKQASRGCIQKIWNGQTKPTILPEDYDDIINFKRSRAS